MATLGNMEIVGQAEELGSIERGKLVGLVVLRDNPREYIGATSTVLMVFKGGRLFHDNRESTGQTLVDGVSAC